MLKLGSGIFLSHIGRSKLLYDRTNHFLTAAYVQHNGWLKMRGKSAVLKVDSAEFINNVRVKFVESGFASAVDVDVAVHVVSEANQLNDIELILYKLRHTPETVKTLHSTHHAVIRSFVNFEQLDSLMKLLRDPINYGIFVDHHSANLLMDYFLKKENFRDATNVAILLMLQEDFESALTSRLAIMSCLKWLRQPPSDSMNDLGTYQKSPPASEEDPVYFKVPYLKNPHFDDHFDLTVPAHLIGKTLALNCRRMPFTPLFASLECVGWTLYGKWSRALDVLDRMERGKLALMPEAAQLATVSLSESKDSSKPESTTPQPEELLKLKKRLEDVIGSKKQAAANTQQVDLEQALLDELSIVQAELERKALDEHERLLEIWNTKREERLKWQVLKVLRQQRLRELQKQREDLASKEQLLFFFENQPLLEQQIHPKLEAMAEERKKKLEEGGLPTDEEYILPEIRQRHAKAGVNT